MVLCNVSDEDFESAVKALNGKLYPDAPEKKSASSGDGTSVIPFVFTHFWLQLDLIFVIFHGQRDVPKECSCNHSLCVFSKCGFTCRVRLPGGVGEEAHPRGGAESQKSSASTHLFLRPEHHRQRHRQRQSGGFWNRSSQGATRTGKRQEYLTGREAQSAKNESFKLTQNAKDSF